MKFRGFPSRMEFTSVPNVFFSGLLPQITDIAELKTTLFVIAELYRKRGYPRFVTYNELLNSSLVDALKGQERAAEEALRAALDMTAERGTLLRVEPEQNGEAGTVYLLNDEQGRKAVEKIQSGEIKIGGLKYRQPLRLETSEQPDIFTPQTCVGRFVETFSNFRYLIISPQVYPAGIFSPFTYYPC